MSEMSEQIQEFEDIIPLEPEPEVSPPPRVIDPSIPPPSAKGKMRMIEESEKLEHQAYHVPAVLLAVGLFSSMVITPLAAQFSSVYSEQPWIALGVHALVFILGVGVGLLLFEICSAFGIVTEAPWKLTSLRIASIYAITDTIAVVLALVLSLQIQFIPSGIALLAFYFMVRWLIDLELQDAAVVTLTLFLPKFFIGLWLGMQFGLI